MEESFEITFKKTNMRVLIGFILLKKQVSGQGDETSGFLRRLVILFEFCKPLSFERMYCYVGSAET
jgi:hypothetical protein